MGGVPDEGPFMGFCKVTHRPCRHGHATPKLRGRQRREKPLQIALSLKGDSALCNVDGSRLERQARCVKRVAVFALFHPELLIPLLAQHLGVVRSR